MDFNAFDKIDKDFHEYLQKSAKANAKLSKGQTWI